MKGAENLEKLSPKLLKHLKDVMGEKVAKLLTIAQDFSCFVLFLSSNLTGFHPFGASRKFSTSSQITLKEQ